MKKIAGTRRKGKTGTVAIKHVTLKGNSASACFPSTEGFASCHHFQSAGGGWVPAKGMWQTTQA